MPRERELLSRSEYADFFEHKRRFVSLREDLGVTVKGSFPGMRALIEEQLVPGLRELIEEICEKNRKLEQQVQQLDERIQDRKTKKRRLSMRIQALRHALSQGPSSL